MSTNTKEQDKTHLQRQWQIPLQWVGGGWGCGGKIEEITYIVPFLALGVVESAGLAVAASLGVVPVVPRRGSVGARGQRRAGCLLSVHLVLGVQPGRAEPHSNAQRKAQPPGEQLDYSKRILQMSAVQRHTPLLKHSGVIVLNIISAICCRSAAEFISCSRLVFFIHLFISISTKFPTNSLLFLYFF